MSNSGDFCLSENMSVQSFVCPIGRILLEKKKAPTHINDMVMARGFIILKRGTPAAFIAVSSKRSPRLPNVMREARRIARGKLSGITEIQAYRKNSASTLISTPFPTKSLICIHRNCIKSMNMHITKVKRKSPKNVFNM